MKWILPAASVHDCQFAREYCDRMLSQENEWHSVEAFWRRQRANRTGHGDPTGLLRSNVSDNEAE
jgi:hypothetical protein